MRGKIIKFSYLARRRRARPSADSAAALPRKNWIFRLLDKTAAPFWFARLRRRLRNYYRENTVLWMYLVSKIVYRIDVRGIENYKHDPSTIIACGHKRDMDIPVIVPRIYLFQRPASQRADLRMLYVATRDDVFERGFLTVYFPLINFARPLLARISLTQLFRILQACPVKLPDEQTVNQLLHETIRLEGNFKLSEAVEEDWQARLAGKAAGRPDLTLKDAVLKAPLEVLRQYATPRMFREPLGGRIRQRHASTMVQQLHSITRILEKGGTLLVLPEGRVTPDGRFCKMRAAVTRLVLQTRVETKLLPINLTYDFMDTARPNVTMLVGPEVANLKQLSKSALAEAIRKNVAGLICVTMSGLAARWLVQAAGEGRASVTPAGLRDELWAEAERLRALGLPVDRQLDTRQEFEERFERFLEYARRRGKIFLDSPAFPADSSQEAGGLYLDLDALKRADCSKHSDNPVRYCYNELTDLLETRGLLTKEPQEQPEPDEVSSFRLKARPSSRRLTAG